MNDLNTAIRELYTDQAPDPGTIERHRAQLRSAIDSSRTVTNPPLVLPAPTPADSAPWHRKPGVRWLTAAAAAAVVTTGGLVAFSGNEASPADEPVAVDTGSANTTPSEVDSEPADQTAASDRSPSVLRASFQPTLFPAFEAGDVRNDNIVALDRAPDSPPAANQGNVWTSITDGPAESRALFGRVDGDTLTDAHVVTAYEELDITAYEESFEASSVMVDGREATLFANTRGTPTIDMLVIESETPVVVSGRDPVAFLELAGPDFINATDQDGVVELSFAAPPDGFEQLVAPVAAPGRRATAVLQVAGGDSGDGALISVATRDPLADMAIGSTAVRVDVGGTVGWQSTEPGYVTTWQIEDGTWVVVAGNATPEGALSMAEDLDFIEEAEWNALYGAGGDDANADPVGEPGTVTDTTVVPFD